MDIAKKSSTIHTGTGHYHRTNGSVIKSLVQKTTAFISEQKGTRNNSSLFIVKLSLRGLFKCEAEAEQNDYFGHEQNILS